MGGKSSTSTSQVTIPPEVLARYNSVNAQAQQVASQPFTPYSSDPNAFVAPLSSTQQAGIANTNTAAGQAQPYYDAATGQLIGAQNAAAPYYSSATQNLAGAQNIGNLLGGASYGALAQGLSSAQAPQQQGYYGSQQLNNAALGQFYNGLAGAQPLQSAANTNLTQAQNIGSLLGGTSWNTIANANATAAPLQGAAAGNISSAAGSASPYNYGAAQQYYTGLNAAQPYINYASQGISSAQAGAQPYTNAASQGVTAAQAGAQPYNQQAIASILGGMQQAQPLLSQSGSTLAGAQAGAQPFINSGSGNINSAMGAAQPLQNAAAGNITGALGGAQPFQQLATNYTLGGAQAVNPGALDSAAINQYMSPYLNTVLQGTAGMLNQQNQMQQSGQLGTAIMSGAFGGDRAGIAAANLAQQQQLANAQIYSNILNQGYGQALTAAEGQQQLGLGAAQANRAALQQGSQQALNIGQQGYSQGLGAAGAQAALGQQQYGQQLGTGQAQAALGQQVYNMGLSSAQQQQQLAQSLYGMGSQAGQAIAGVGQQQFGQGVTAAQAQAALGQQQFGQGVTAAQAQAGLGQQQFGMNSTAGQNLAGLGQNIYGQQLGTGAAQAQLGQQLFGQGATTAEQQAALSQLLYGQGTGTAQQQAALGQQIFGQGATTGQNVAGVGQQVYGQGTGYGQQVFGQGATTAQQLAALGQQQFGQGATTAQQQAALGQLIYGTGAQTSQSLAGLGAGAQAAGLQGAQAQLAAGQQEQQTQQAGLTALYNQFLQQQSYPFQVAQFLANIAEGTGSLSGSTTTTTQPGGFFSDRRVKEGIKPIGKTFDGQTVYQYRYKGEPETRIGLIAQEVEKKHPEAVGLAGGFKTVRYDKATDDAAKRGHFASGGLVLPEHAGLGYADGGYAGFDPMMAQLMAENLKGMYAPIFAGQSGLGALGGAGGGIVPKADLPVHQLQTAGPAPQQPSAAESMKQTTEALQGLESLGKDVRGMFGKGHPAAGGSAANDITVNQDWRKPWSEQPLPTQDDSVLKDLLGLGGASDFAMGGAVDDEPYKNDISGLQMDIPDDNTRYELQKPASAPGAPESGLSKVGKVASVIGTVAKIIPFFSDKRLKENIKPVGKTFDGQTIYSYRYKGDHETRMGLIAQEVEKKHPAAVGAAHGFKTVDYAKATKPSAKRGKFADGGSADDDPTPLPGALRTAINPLGKFSSVNELRKDDTDADDDTSDKGGASQPQEDTPAASAKAAAPSGGGAPSAPPADTRKPAQPAKKPAPVTPIKGSIGQIASWIASAEGTGKNPTSSAVGKYQMVNDTFVRTFKQMYPDRAKGMTDSQIVALRRTPAASELYDEMGPYLIKQNADALSKAGYAPTPGNVYLAHFFGPAGAKTILGADPSTPVIKLVGPSVVAANRSVLAGKTAGDVIGWTNNRIAQMAAHSRSAFATGGAIDDIVGNDMAVAPDDGETDDQKRQRLLARALAAAQSGSAPMPSAQTLAAPVPANDQPAPIPMQDSTKAMLTPEALHGLGVLNGQAPAAPEGLAAAQFPGTQIIPTAPGATSASRMGEDAAPAGLAPQPKPEGHGFFHDIKHGKTDALLALLSGIAAMGTAPTRSLGVALAAGLGAGTQAYQRQREFGLEQQYTGAKTASAASGILATAMQNFDNQYRYNDAASDPSKRWLGPAGYESVEAHNARRQQYIESVLGGVKNMFPQQDLKGMLPTNIMYGAAPQPVTPPAAPSVNMVGGAPAAAPAAPSNIPSGNPLTPTPQQPAAPKTNSYGIESFYSQVPNVAPETESQIDDPKMTVGYWKGVLNDSLGRGATAAADQAQSMINKLLTGEIVPTVHGVPFNGYTQYASGLKTVQANIAHAQETASQAREAAGETASLYRDTHSVIGDIDRASQQQALEGRSPQWASFISSVESIPGIGQLIPSETLNQYKNASQTEAQNSALLAIYRTLNSGIGSRAQATTEKIFQNGVNAQGTVGSAARYAMITQLKALLQMKKDEADALLSHQPGEVLNTDKFHNDWLNSPQHSFNKYRSAAVRETPFYAGMTANDMKSFSDALPMFRRGARYQEGQWIRTPHGAIVQYTHGGFRQAPQ